MIPLFVKLSFALCNASLVTGFLTMMKTIISTTIEAYTDTMIDNPFVGDGKVVEQIVVIMENLLDFDNSGFRRRRTMEGGCNCGTGGEMINSLLS